MHEDVNEPPLTPKRYQNSIKIKEPIKPDKVVYSSHMELQEEPNIIVDYAPGKRVIREYSTALMDMLPRSCTQMDMVI